MNDDVLTLAGAIEDFRDARQRAMLQEILARFRGQPVDLLSYDEVRRKLKAQSVVERGLHDIPLDSIVGSVNRYRDFTRGFLPRGSIEPSRWARVEVIAKSPEGPPPIEVYKIGETYFVKDGNHRVSVARQLGATHILANVEEVMTPVPMTPDVTADDIILKAEYANFLDRTHISQIRPQANLILTAPGQYALLEEHIAVHRYFMGIDFQREISYEEAVAHWFDTIYMPIAQIIQRTGILRDFPGRTEADLYLWIAEHRSDLQDELGREVRPEAAALDLVDQFSPTFGRRVSRISGKILSTLIPDNLETGPSTGEWRKARLIAAGDQPATDSGIPPVGSDMYLNANELRLFASKLHLFADVLVTINGREDGWFALDQAIEVARREGANLHGLHVVPDPVQKESDPVRAVANEFNLRCQKAGIQAQLALDTGEVSTQIIDQARWNDLVIVNLTYPPASQPLAALSSGFRKLLQRCPRPLLAVPQVFTPLNRPLLAYDGSPRAREALFIATYLAGQWNIPLTVITILESNRVTQETIKEARDYLDAHQIQATYLVEDRPAVEAILSAIDDQGCDFLLMGGYAHNPVLDVVLGSTVDRTLREARKPILICR